MRGTNCIAALACESENEDDFVSWKTICSSVAGSAANAETGAGLGPTGVATRTFLCCTVHTHNHLSESKHTKARSGVGKIASGSNQIKPFRCARACVEKGSELTSPR